MITKKFINVETNEVMWLMTEEDKPIVSTPSPGSSGVIAKPSLETIEADEWFLS